MGITPARAGKRALQPAPDRRHGNYPRSRGEEQPRPIYRNISLELPPLARGRVVCGCFSGLPGGITPARAGKSSGVYRGNNTYRNYPRSRGEE